MLTPEVFVAVLIVAAFIFLDGGRSGPFVG